MRILFTGIIRELGRTDRIYRGGSRYQIRVQADEVLDNVKRGDSIAVNGVCLTVVSYDNSGFTADVMPETLRRTNLQDLASGDPVNLEPSLGTDDLFDGHIVTGHIDGLGKLRGVKREDNARGVEIGFPSGMERFLVEKGSIAVNGISLTLVSVEEDYFTVSLIPESWRATNLESLKIGDHVNLETDILGKYVVKTVENYLSRDVEMSGEETGKGLSREILQKNNFM